MKVLAGCMVTVLAILNLASAQGIFSMFPCQGRVTYKVTIAYSWSAATHPMSYPEGGFFSPLVIASHGAYYTMWSPLGYSSPGVQMVAETGGTSAIVDELLTENYRNVFQRVVADGPASGTSTISYMIDVHGARPFISAISMFFPSPDWFTGFDNVNMCDEETGEYVEVKEGNLSAWDAGTDDGETFTSEDVPLEPGRRTPIISILASTFQGIPPGTYTIEKVGEEA
uniref:Spondin domain-containing protein n=1 Tax=Rhodosorus marinus TaxID=101924 RepID=A0A7S3A380_9RHOD|mmetsp:Transcript_40683/g.161284  ORF Transcript_40683/g.161284 Transcript_40683/m.161284 type:complete len:227 (+) Transcript_40683:266-946(+)